MSDEVRLGGGSIRLYRYLMKEADGGPHAHIAEPKVYSSPGQSTFGKRANSFRIDKIGRHGDCGATSILTLTSDITNRGSTAHG